MTEAEWLGLHRLGPMLEFLRGKVSERKLRLFACGCARRIWERINPATPAEIELSEAFADGQASTKAMEEKYDLLVVPREPRSAWAAYAALQWLIVYPISESEVAESVPDFAAQFLMLLDGEQNGYNAIRPETDAQKARGD